MLCKLCGGATGEYGELRVLDAFDAHYRMCAACQFVFAADPSWLDKAYDTPIAASDTGIAVRNLRFAAIIGALIPLCFHDARRFLDFGGGAGLFVRLMRDQGFNFYLEDKYCENLFAVGFEADDAETFDLTTCLEVIEHIPEPMPIFVKLAQTAPTIVLSTELLPATRNKPGEWWYYTPESGQHVSFFSRRSLEVVAGKLGMSVASNGRDLHVLSRRPVSDRLLHTLSSKRGLQFGRILVRLLRRKRRSLTYSDAALVGAVR
jgi:Methyltransferase domain